MEIDVASMMEWVQINIPPSLAKGFDAIVYVQDARTAWSLMIWLGCEKLKYQRVVDLLDPNKPRVKTSYGCTFQYVQRPSPVTEITS